MIKDKLKKEKLILLALILLSLLALTACVVFMFKFFINKNYSLGFVIIFGATIFFSFYALVVFTVRYLYYEKLQKLQKTIIENKILKIEDLTKFTKKSKAKTEKDVLFLIKNNFLEDFKLTKDGFLYSPIFIEKKEEQEKKVEVKEQEPIAEKVEPKAKILTKQRKCPCCGATLNETDEKLKCLYCGYWENLE